MRPAPALGGRAVSAGPATNPGEDLKEMSHLGLRSALCSERRPGGVGMTIKVTTDLEFKPGHEPGGWRHCLRKPPGSLSLYFPLAGLVLLCNIGLAPVSTPSPWALPSPTVSLPALGDVSF